MMTLKKHLKACKVEKGLCELILFIEDICREIYDQLETSIVQYVMSENSSGDKQLNLDLIADEILVKYLDKSDLVSCYTSEERPLAMCFNKKHKGAYFVAYDPLDGSSVVEAGLAVGTVIGIYKDVQELTDATGRDQVAAVYVLYGSPIKIVYTVKNGTHVFSMNRQGHMMLETENITLKNKNNICSVGGFQNALKLTGYHDLIHYWMKNKYTLRYSGSMTGDIHNILKKGGGIFAYPGDKMRLLFEANPFALIIEQAGGKASDGKRNILDIPITSIGQKVPVLIGSKKDVEIAKKYLS